MLPIQATQPIRNTHKARGESQGQAERTDPSETLNDTQSFELFSALSVDMMLLLVAVNWATRVSMLLYLV